MEPPSRPPFGRTKHVLLLPEAANLDSLPNDRYHYGLRGLLRARRGGGGSSRSSSSSGSGSASKPAASKSGSSGGGSSSSKPKSPALAPPSPPKAPKAPKAPSLPKIPSLPKPPKLPKPKSGWKPPKGSIPGSKPGHAPYHGSGGHDQDHNQAPSTRSCIDPKGLDRLRCEKADAVIGTLFAIIAFFLVPFLIYRCVTKRGRRKGKGRNRDQEDGLEMTGRERDREIGERNDNIGVAVSTDQKSFKTAKGERRERSVGDGQGRKAPPAYRSKTRSGSERSGRSRSRSPRSGSHRSGSSRNGSRRSASSRNGSQRNASPRGVSPSGSHRSASPRGVSPSESHRSASPRVASPRSESRNESQSKRRSESRSESRGRRGQKRSQSKDSTSSATSSLSSGVIRTGSTRTASLGRVLRNPQVIDLQRPSLLASKKDPRWTFTVTEVANPSSCPLYSEVEGHDPRMRRPYYAVEHNGDSTEVAGTCLNNHIRSLARAEQQKLTEAKNDGSGECDGCVRVDLDESLGRDSSSDEEAEWGSRSSTSSLKISKRQNEDERRPDDTRSRRSSRRTSKCELSGQPDDEIGTANYTASRHPVNRPGSPFPCL